MYSVDVLRFRRGKFRFGVGRTRIFPNKLESIDGFAVRGVIRYRRSWYQDIPKPRLFTRSSLRPIILAKLKMALQKAKDIS